MGRKGSKGFNSRRIAALALYRWLSSKRIPRPELSEVIENVIASELSTHGSAHIARERALINELVFGSVRWLLLLDFVLKRYCPSFDALDPLVHAFLLVGAYQILFLSRVPKYAAINETVEAVKKGRVRKASGLVNAVLRRISREAGTIIQERASVLPVHIRYSHPEWMVKRWVNRFGERNAFLILQGNNKRPPLTLRINSLNVDREGFLALLEKAGIQARPAPFSPQGVIVSRRMDPVLIPGYGKGLFQVQDEGAQLVTFLLHPLPRERVLDACAGVGGKTSHIVELQGGEGEVWALEPNERRRAKLMENLRRLGMGSIVQILHESHTMGMAKEFKGFFQKVLVDAPCSGLGVIRRHPDIKWNRREEDIGRLSEKQIGILNTLKDVVAIGGVIVYATCSIEPEETWHVVDAFLRENSQFELEEACGFLPKAAKTLCQKGCLLSLPPDTDGFFAARLRRRT